MCFQNNNAQASLEYLLTYGWGLVLIATVIGVLVFIASPVDSEATIFSSAPGKIMIKGASFLGDGTTIKLQNIAGGNIKITKIVFPTGYSNCLVNGVNPLDEITVGIPFEILAGGEINITCDEAAQTVDSILIIYKDPAGLEQSVSITPSKPIVEPVPPTVISSCGYVVTESGYYMLESDLQASGTLCINVSGTDNVLIDCQGHRIFDLAKNGVGVYASEPGGSVEQLTVKNCTFDFLTLGIWVKDVVGGTFRNNVATDNLKFGFNFENLSNSLVEGNITTNTGVAGIAIEGNDNLVKNNISCGLGGVGFECSGLNNTGFGNKGPASNPENFCDFTIDSFC